MPLNDKHKFTFATIQLDKVIVIPGYNGQTTEYQIDIDRDASGTSCSDSPYLYPSDLADVKLPSCQKTKLEDIWIKVTEPNANSGSLSVSSTPFQICAVILLSHCSITQV